MKREMDFSHPAEISVFSYGHKLGHHLKCFKFIITVAVIGLSLAVYFKLEVAFDSLSYFYIFMLISILPVVYLYLEYLYFNSRSTFLKINRHARKAIFSVRGTSVEIDFDEIKEVVLHRSPSWTRKDRVQMLPFEHFHYARISTESETIIFTCLLTGDVEIALETADCFNVVQRTRLFPSVLME